MKSHPVGGSKARARNILFAAKSRGAAISTRRMLEKKPRYFAGLWVFRQSPLALGALRLSSGTTKGGGAAFVLLDAPAFAFFFSLLDRCSRLAIRNSFAAESPVEDRLRRLFSKDLSGFWQRRDVGHHGLGRSICFEQAPMGFFRVDAAADHNIVHPPGRIKR